MFYIACVQHTSIHITLIQLFRMSCGPGGPYSPYGHHGPQGPIGPLGP